MQATVRRVRVLLVLTALALATGCTKPVPPTITPERATITGIDPQAIHLDVELTATNPNSVDLPVQGVAAHVLINGNIDMGQIKMAQAVVLPAGKSTKLTAPLVARWTDVGSLAQLAASSPLVPFDVDGTVELGGTALTVSVPFHIRGTITHEQIVGAALRSIPVLAP